MCNIWESFTSFFSIKDNCHILKMDAAGSSEIFVSVYQITRHLSRQDLKLQISQQATPQLVLHEFGATQNTKTEQWILLRPPPHFLPSLYLLHSHIALGLTSVLLLTLSGSENASKRSFYGDTAELRCWTVPVSQLYGAAKSIDTLREFVANTRGFSDVTQ